MNIIVAADKHWGIGNKGDLLVTIPGDQKMFRDETLGKVVVMGRKTLESLPGGQPLYGRTNIVLTKDIDFKVKGAIVCHSFEAAMQKLSEYRSEDIFIAGGQSIYEQFLPYCEIVHMTYIDYTYAADTYFPNLDELENWRLKLVSEEETYFDICYEFRMYQNTELKIF